MNLGGIKVGSLELERLVNDHPSVYESAAIAVQPEGEGAEQLVVYVVLEEDATGGTNLVKELRARVAKHLNPLFKISDVVVVDALPRTASNKIMRRRLRSDYSERTSS